MVESLEYGKETSGSTEDEGLRDWLTELLVYLLKKYSAPFSWLT
jgi:hypothetical protein